MNFSVFCLLLFLWGSASETSGLVILYLSLLCFFTHLLKFYSGGAVDLWSCFHYILPFQSAQLLHPKPSLLPGQLSELG